ncbi:uncharacterized protein LOC121730583 [Aricia agestis]|uniref:uncharacterized protein LOC121730583 n=1 Tax=Aricia agestis TaxID=91739 RepID=UPI001C20AE52|nr:uncharacterized protein LOC121730583 [Aricia agestis]
MTRIVIALALLVASSVDGQMTAQSSVAPDLRECYTNTTLLNRNNLPPTTMAVLIDIIRKIEDNPNVNVDLRQLAVLLLHTFRQDGIEYHQPEMNMGTSSNILPYAPTFHAFHRHRLLVSRIIPNNLQVATLSNTINSELKCALHHMLSTTVDARLRGDESSCNQLSQYRALRTARDLRHRLMKDDVEILDLKTLNPANTNGQMRQWNPKDDVEFSNINGVQSEKQLLGDSTCPLLDGVAYTKWGAVSAGNVIAGIAAGAQLQNVPILELVKGSVLNNPNVQQYVTSIYPATLTGDLAEAILIQGTQRANSAIQIGAAGNWNSTQAPRYFMLHSRTNVEMTDPEIRGDIDGFVLGSLLSSGFDSNQLKLSQLLDMYYSPRNGVNDPSRRACNRRQLSQQYIINTNLVTETYAFATALDTNIPLPGTIMGGLEELSNNAVSNFQSYTSSNLNDMNCFNTETSTSDFRLKTNLYLVVDATWQYQTIYPAISYLLDNIEVGKFGSSVTLLNAFDGGVVVEKTFSLAHFHAEYTLTKHQSMFTGVNLENTLGNIRLMMQSELENEKTANYVGGNSTVLLFLISSSLQNSQTIWEQARMLNETVPDMRILFATATNQFDNLWNLVRDMHNDIKTISLSSDGRNVDLAMNPVLERINEVGRRIINPNCGSTYSNEQTSGTRQFDDYVEPGYTNYYAISPNYFYGNNDNRKVRISRSMAGVGSLIVCQSRVFAQPRQNPLSDISQDSNDVICQTIATTGNVEINMQGACDGRWTIGSCPPFYISVHSNVPNGTNTFSTFCTENACRFPYNMRYQVQIEEFGCFSSATNIGTSMGLILVSAFVYLLRL